jgi:Family of unknown function (DUF6174)
MRMSHMNRYLAAAIVVIAMAIAWPSVAPADNSNVDPAITNGNAIRKFSAARNKWLAAGISNYRFKINASCFCAYIGDVSVTVRGRKKTSSNPDWFGPRSVPALFKVIHGAIDRNAAALIVKYDKSDGHPQSISIDYSHQIADEEIGYTVKGFGSLPTRN